MVGEHDNKDKHQARKLAIAFAGLIVLLGIASFLILPMLGEFTAVHFSPGLGLKESAVLSFFITMVVMVVLAIAAGDGLLGEIQFILGGFFLFFVIVWLMVAWIF